MVAAGMFQSGYVVGVDSRGFAANRSRAASWRVAVHHRPDAECVMRPDWLGTVYDPDNVVVVLIGQPFVGNVYPDFERVGRCGLRLAQTIPQCEWVALPPQGQP